MPQAGVSLPEYPQVREGSPVLDVGMRSEVVKQITLQPVRRHKGDAAIFFGDIVVPLKAVAIDVGIKPGVGRLIADPIRTLDDLPRLRPLEP
ncbi:uroporphyrinogen decarboxylase family protein, partial [Saccharothrix sp. ST-888]|uniref:uroporphyrinogen decarboxylase family protein n=1 Tax=Saccharothrix sp. ST-888 TaxID=1427391 RepID=UPI002F3F4951